MYQVMKVPKIGGEVITIAPVVDLGKVRCVYRSVLKTRIWKDYLVPALTDPPALGEENRISN